MTFPFNVYFWALLGAFGTTLVALPFWRYWSHHLGLVDDPGNRKIHHTSVPLAGGLAVMSGLFVPMLIGILLVQFDRLEFNTVGLLGYGLNRRALQLLAIFVGALGMLLLGLADDKWELRPGIKFIGQCAIALMIATSGVRITLFVENVFFSYCLTIFWILIVTNAFNFMDNMNGLCGGLGFISAFYFALSSASAGQYLVALLAFLIGGALLGFLPYNFPKATAFLGDSGSHLVGYLLSILAILPHFYSAQHSRKLAVLAPLLILAIPLLDLVWVVIWRWKIGQPFYVGDNNHCSHQLVKRGWSKTSAVLFLWLLSVALGGLAFTI